MITYEELKNGAIKIGKITEAKMVKGADKLISMKVDFGTEQRRVVTAMAQFYRPEELVGKVMPFVVDIAPAAFMGVTSEAMILAPNPGKPIFLKPEKDVPLGTIVF